jgi:hypothetical protein
MAVPNLTPEQLAALQRAYAQMTTPGTQQYGNGGLNVGGLNFGAQYDTSGPSGEAGFGNTHQLQSYYGSDPAHQNPGDALYNYDTNGNYTNTSQINPDRSMQDFLTFLAGATGMGLAGGAMTAAAAGAGGAGGAAAGGLANGAFLGEGVASGVPAWDAAATNAGLSLTGSAGAGSQFNINGAGTDMASADAVTNGGGVSSTADGNPYASSGDYTNGSDIMSDTFDANGAHGAAGFGGGTGTWQSALLNAVGGSGSGYGRILSSLLGGALGSHGTQTTTSTQRTIDPRMVPYVYGDGTANNPGILGYTSSLLRSQMAPGAMQGYTDMQNVGRGLLNQPVAGNGFTQFFGSHR